MKSSKVGINRIVITAPGLYMRAEQMAIVLAPDDVESDIKRKLKEGKITERPSEEEIQKVWIPRQTPKTEQKIKEGLMVESFRLSGYSETNATFVANGVYEFVKRIANDNEALEKLRAEPIREVYYGTESNPDRSRPELEVSILLASSKLLKEDDKKYRPIIEMIRNARLVPITYACVGGILSVCEATKAVRLAGYEGRSESALVISADTACYNKNKAPGAEATQGAAAALLWITKNPSLVEVGKKTGSFHMTLSDFTKFVDELPYVHGKFSEYIYVYIMARALEDLENEYRNSRRKGKMLNQLDFFICHVPFPKQAIYMSTFLFVHWMKNHHPEAFAEMQKRPGIGKEPLPTAHLTQLFDNKFKEFNTNGVHNQERDIIAYIERDPDITAYWGWLKGIREGNVPEYDAFKKKLQIEDALSLPAIIGNSYSAAALLALASALINSEGRNGIVGGYGSGAQSVVFPVTRVAKQRVTDGRIVIELEQDPRYEIDAARYHALHAEHLLGDSVRTTKGDDLVEKDRLLLRGEALPKGFHVVRRNPDATGEYIYSDGITSVPVRIRY